MARYVTFALASAASVALIACDQGPAAEAEREAEAVEAMTNDLRSDAERAARVVDSHNVVSSGKIADHGKTKTGAMAGTANTVSD